MMRPCASIIIPHHRNPTALHACLTALLACDGIAKAEIIVVDNGPRSLTQTFMRDFPSVQFLYEPRAGAAYARNYAAKLATADIFLFLDCDCVPHRGFMNQHLLALKSADLVGGEIEVSTTHPMSGPEAFERVFAFQQRRYISQKGFSVTANLSTHRAVFEHIGPFRHGVSEDLDWCHRARALGHQIAFAEKARATHPARKTWAELTKKWHRLTDEAYSLHRAQGHSTLAWRLRAIAMPFSVFVHAPIILATHKLPDATTKWRAVRTLTSIRLWRMRQMLRLAARPPEQAHLVPETTHRSR